MKSRLFGVLLFIETVALLLTALVAFYYHLSNGENDYQYFLISAAVTGTVALIFFLIGRLRKKTIDSDDTFVIVSLSWVLFSVFGMLPFLLSGSITNVTDAFFETLSGFTTTGATILKNVDEQTHGILFWRAIMQWLGGLGMVVFTLAFIPSVAKGSRRTTLFAAEAPSVIIERLSPTMHGTSRILWIIYIFLTVLCTVFYALGPMSFFDAVCYGMSTISTGGFSNHQDSIAHFQSTYIENVSIVFMLLSSINFASFFFLVMGRFDIIRKNEELRVYLITIFVMTLIFIGLFYWTPNFKDVTEAQLESYPKGFRDTFQVSFFHVVSMLSNTGFSGHNYNYDQWGLLFVIPTLMMQVVGGCAGSASGGVKMLRVIVIFKFIRNAFRELLHPTGMYTLKISGQTIDELIVRRVCNFVSLGILLMVVNVVALTLCGLSLEDASIAFITCFSNIGLGSGATGPGASLADLPTAAKWICSADMLIGRLEIITVFLIFFRSTWVTTDNVRK